MQLYKKNTNAHIDVSKGNNSQESFEQFGGLGLSFRSFSIKKPVPITQ